MAATTGLLAPGADEREVRSLAAPVSWVQVYLGTAGVVFLLMMALGTLMRLAQGGWVTLSPAWFYQILTLHGVGMVGISGLSGAAILWHFLSRHVDLDARVLVLNFACFLLGVVLLFAPVLFAGYAGAWTFLYPLPQTSGGAWTARAAAVHLVGLLVVGVGFLLFHLETARAILRRHGSLGAALGWPQLFGRSSADPPPPAVIAGTMVCIVNTLGLVSGAAVLVMSIASAIEPGFAVDPLLAKNLIFFFGHVFINATIYMSVVAVYEILPRYAMRPWRVSRVFLLAWTASTVTVMIVYPHHLLMDFAMPRWMLVMGQVISYASGLPVLLVTAYGALALVHRSGIRWDTASRLAFLSVFGWAAGVIPAVVDGTIAVNRVMHNTQWVPGHFHFYLLLGLLPMVFAFMYFVALRGRALVEGPVDRAAFHMFVVGGLGVVATFLAAGHAGVPRRFAVHLPEWLGFDRVGAIFGALAVAAVCVFVARCVGAFAGRTRDA